MVKHRPRSKTLIALTVEVPTYVESSYCGGYQGDLVSIAPDMVLNVMPSSMESQKEDLREGS